jgi:hypothetical protein
MADCRLYGVQRRQRARRGRSAWIASLDRPRQGPNDLRPGAELRSASAPRGSRDDRPRRSPAALPALLSPQRCYLHRTRTPRAAGHRVRGAANLRGLGRGSSSPATMPPKGSGSQASTLVSRGAGAGAVAAGPRATAGAVAPRRRTPGEPLSPPPPRLPRRRRRTGSSGACVAAPRARRSARALRTALNSPLLSRPPFSSPRGALLLHAGRLAAPGADPDAGHLLRDHLHLRRFRPPHRGQDSRRLSRGGGGGAAAARPAHRLGARPGCARRPCTRDARDVTEFV